MVLTNINFSIALRTCNVSGASKVNKTQK